MKCISCLLLASLLFPSLAVCGIQASEKPDEKTWITLDQNTYELLQTIAPATKSYAVQPLANGLKFNGQPLHDRIHIVQIKTGLLDELSRRIHRVEHHCGGYIRHPSLADAKASLKSQKSVASFTRPSYEITHQSLVNPMLEQMAASNIEQTILALSAFPNRYYKSDYGIQASNWLADKWRTMASNRPDISVEQIYRNIDTQASVVLTIEGNELADQVVVLGAHLDSLNIKDSNYPPNSPNYRAPGADDDASGVASLTEVLRVLVANDYQPQRTIKLMAYAAEEVGLDGSRYISENYSDKGVNVVGVLQLDMTNYKGSVGDVYLIDDYTDSRQNEFLETVAATYLPALEVAYTTCGYACSDHANWTARGYPASFPFESMFYDYNPAIHSRNDTYANSGGQATHSLKFARLALAYSVELGDVYGKKVEVNVHHSGSGSMGVVMLVWLLGAGLMRRRRVGCSPCDR